MMASWNLLCNFNQRLTSNVCAFSYCIPNVVVEKSFPLNFWSQLSSMLGFQVLQNFSLWWLLQCNDFEVQVRLSRP